MKRRALHIIVLLLLGAIVNVAVAWGCFCACQGSKPQSDHDTATVMRALSKYTPTGWTMIPSTCQRMDAFGVQAMAAFGKFGSEVPIATDEYFERVVVGWPTPSLQRTALITNNLTWKSPYKDAIRIGRLHYPIRPLAVGTSVNTIFYAAILWGMFAVPLALRRRRRLKRGLCPACAYPIGASPVCTECGAKLPLPPGEGRGEGAHGSPLADGHALTPDPSPERRGE
jgi:hypothetical protein